MIVPDSPVNKPKPKRETKKKLLHINKPPKKVEKKTKDLNEYLEQPRADYFYGLVPDEINKNAKGLILKTASLPARGKSDILFLKLANSKYINEYLSKYLHLDYLAGMNDHLKLGLVYGVNYMEAMMYRNITPEQVVKETEPENKNIVI